MALSIPAGYIHRSELIKRGWQARDIKEFLIDFVKVDAPEGVSNKAYKVEDVEAAEAANGELAKRVAARLAEIPREEGTLGADDVISASELKARGWTPAHIKRLLGDPERFGCWSIKRVEIAEATDAKLQKRLATVAKREAEAEAAREEARKAAYEAAIERKREAEKAAKAARAEKLDQLAKAQPIFRKRGNSWMVQGEGLAAGQEVDVKRQDGSIARVIIDSVDADGFATFHTAKGEAKKELSVEDRAVAKYGEAARVIGEYPDFEIGDSLGFSAGRVIEGKAYEAVEVIERNESYASVVMLPAKH